MKHLMKSWKTGIAGLITIGTAVMAGLGKITPETATAITAVAVGTGMIAAKDSNVTGGPKP